MVDETGPGQSADDVSDRPQDRRVERMRPDPAVPPERAQTMVGFLGDSDRPGFRRLYFTRELDHYAEFRVEDVVDVVDKPADRQPFLGEEATQVAIRKDAVVEFARTRTIEPPDEFDLDVRLASRHRRLGWAYRARGGDTEVQTHCGACLVPYTVDDPTCAETCNNVAWTCAVACWTLVGGCETHYAGACWPLPPDTGAHFTQCPCGPGLPW